MLQAQLKEHIETNGGTCKNGSYKKRVRSDAGELELNIPRDSRERQGEGSNDSNSILTS